MTTACCAAAALLPLLLVIDEVAADDVEVDVTVDVTTVSDYVWRGDRMSASGATPAAQSYLELGLSGPRGDRLAIGAWTSAFVRGPDRAYEVDPYLSYAMPFGPATITAGHAIYVVTAADPVDTMHETSLAVSFESLPVVPSAGVAVDVVRTDGWYAWAALAHEGSEGPVTFETRLEAGASAAAMVAAGVQHVTLSSRASVPLGDRGVYIATSGALAYGVRTGVWGPTLALSLGVSR